MKFIKISGKDLEKILEDFARDLTCHSVMVNKKGEPYLPVQSKNLINEYIIDVEKSTPD